MTWKFRSLRYLIGCIFFLSLWCGTSVFALAGHHPDPVIRTELENLFDDPPLVEGYPFQRELAAAAGRYQLPLPFVLAVARGESFFDPQAKSAKGAIGIMQVMPKTAAIYGIDQEWLADPATNIDVGVHFLADLYAKYKDPYLSLAAYFCGCGGVDAEALTSRKDCDEYVRYIHSHLKTILADARNGNRLGNGTNTQVIATFDNFLDGEKFQSLLSDRLADWQFDLFRKEIMLEDHNRYQYQVIASVAPETDRGLCQEVEEVTGFSLCEK